MVVDILLLLICSHTFCYRQRYSSIAQNRRGADINFLSFLTQFNSFFVLTHTPSHCAHYTCTCTDTLKRYFSYFAVVYLVLHVPTQQRKTYYCSFDALLSAMHVRVSPSFAVSISHDYHALFSSKTTHTYTLDTVALFFFSFSFSPNTWDSLHFCLF